MISDRYAAFRGTSMRVWLKDDLLETYVRGKGWIPQKDVSVGDKMIFGEVIFIGTEEEVKNFLNHIDLFYTPTVI